MSVRCLLFVFLRAGRRKASGPEWPTLRSVYGYRPYASSTTTSWKKGSDQIILLGAGGTRKEAASEASGLAPSCRALPPCPGSHAGYFARNIRAVEVLIDQDAIRRAGPPDEPWKLYDLGHGYCSYDFFDQCPHRMACARCDFYMPKESSKAQSIEAKANLLRLTQEIPLNEDELRAVEAGIARAREVRRQACFMPDSSSE